MHFFLGSSYLKISSVRVRQVGHDWAFTQKSMQFLALCQGGSGSILLWKSISSDQVAICMPKTHFAYQSLQSAAAFLPNVCQKNQWEIVLGGLADA